LGIKALLEDTMKTSKYNLYILIMIISSVLSIPILFINVFMPEHKKLLGFFLIALSIVNFIAYLIVFFKTRKIESILQPQWKRFCMINIWTGICFISIILIPVGLILNIISSIYGAFVFKKALAQQALV
jgi:hypothetical protein